MMMLIDLTNELSPILLGLDILFALSAAAVFGPPAVAALARSFRNQPRPRIVVHRPILAR